MTSEIRIRFKGPPKPKVEHKHLPPKPPPLYLEDDPVRRKWHTLQWLFKESKKPRGKPRCYQSQLRDYIESIKNADTFLLDRGTRFYIRQHRMMCARIVKRLRSVDPEGTEKLLAKVRTVQQHKAGKIFRKRWEKRRELEVVRKKKIQETVDTVKKEIEETPGLLPVKSIPIEGLKNLAVMMLAGGLARADAAKMMSMPLEDFNSMMEGVDADAPQALQQKAIIALANSKVVKDLVGGVVTKETAIADQIASRRIKLTIDAHEEGRKSIPADPSMEKEREKHLENRFGVVRKEGRVVDGEVIKERNEK